MSNHYDCLGVPREASQDEIKKAYRRLTIQWHPDKHQNNPGAEERYKKIVLAYEVLSDADKRRAYDLGFNPASGVFDPSNLDPSLLEPDEFIKTFVGLFGDYLDARVPGGFRGRVKKAAHPKGPKTNKKKPKKHNICDVCGGSGRIELKQGTFKIFIGCKKCS